MQYEIGIKAKDVFKALKDDWAFLFCSILSLQIKHVNKDITWEIFLIKFL